MFENIFKFFKKAKNEEKKNTDSKSAAKERLQLVLMQDRANVSADFLDLMRHEIIEVIKKYIDVDENSIDVRLTNIENEDGTNGAPALYANIPILNIKNEARKVDSSKKNDNKEVKNEIKKEEKVENEPKKEDEQENKNEEKEEVKQSEEQEEVKENNEINENKEVEKESTEENENNKEVKENELNEEKKDEEKELESTTENK